MKNLTILLVLVCGLIACEKPYENVSVDKRYKGQPFVSLSSEQASINLGIDQGNNQSIEEGVFRDSLVLSHVLEEDLTVLLEMVDVESVGQQEINFSFQHTVTIEAGQNYGSFNVRALELKESELSQYKLAIRIKEVDNENVIAGLYGAKKENEEREKRFKTYSFQ